MAFQLDAALPAPLVPLAWLIGRWEGAGVVGYPTMDSVNFGQEVEFRHDGRPFLHYRSQAWLLDDEGNQVRPLASEVGFWRPKETGLEVTSAGVATVKELIALLEGQMKEAAASLDFETAARLRDQLLLVLRQRDPGGARRRLQRKGGQPGRGHALQPVQMFAKHDDAREHEEQRTELAHDLVGVVTEDVADDLLAVTGVDGAQVAWGLALVVREGGHDRVGAGRVGRVRVQATQEGGEGTLGRLGDLALVHAELARELADGDLVHDLVERRHA